MHDLALHSWLQRMRFELSQLNCWSMAEEVG